MSDEDPLPPEEDEDAEEKVRHHRELAQERHRGLRREPRKQ